MHLLVLSAFRLNAGETSPTFRGVSMHLLVLSAFRLRENGLIESRLILSQCTFWCSVLSDEVNRRLASRIMQAGLNAPSGAQCFPTRLEGSRQVAYVSVSMHLLVLSAFRPRHGPWPKRSRPSLNAPSGAQCFPTGKIVPIHIAQHEVSMHLLVLSAFRP